MQWLNILLEMTLKLSKCVVFLFCCCLWNCSDYTEYAVLIWTGLSCANGILGPQLDGVLLLCLKIASCYCRVSRLPHLALQCCSDFEDLHFEWCIVFMSHKYPYFHKMDCIQLDWCVCHV